MSEPIDHPEILYREVPGFPGYRVGDDGSVWTQWQRGRWFKRLADWRQMKTPPDNHGYPQINLRDANRRKRHFRLHMLVMLAFRGLTPPDLEIRHLNCDPLDNRLENLAFGTSLENSADTVRMGRQCKGETRPKAKLTWAKVAAIRYRAAQGERQKELAMEYGVSDSVISEIVAGKMWKQRSVPDAEVN